MKELIDRNKLLEDMPKNDELFSMDVRRVILEQPIVEAVPMDFHDRCMELEIKQRFAAEKRNREEHRAEGDDATRATALRPATRATALRPATRATVLRPATRATVLRQK